MVAETLSTPVIAEPLHVSLVGTEVVLDGSPLVAVSLTASAAIKTGVQLIYAGMRLEALERGESIQIIFE